MIRVVDALEPFRAVLADAGYDVEVRSVADLGEVLLAETRHALVMCAICEWDYVRGRVDEAQAALTQLAAEHPSPRAWDLYVVAIIDDQRDMPDRELLEADTRYARKLVAVGVGDSTKRATHALRPLLPLEGAAPLEPIDPLSAIRAELLDLDVDASLADAALESFKTTRTVRIP